MAREKLLHLNDPLWQRYWIWFSDAIHGNLGNTTKGQPVAPQLRSHLFVTLRMVIVATVIAIFVAIVLGVWAAVRQNKLADHAITVTNFVLLATPVFVLGPRPQGVRGHPDQPAPRARPSSTPTASRARR